jgi:hypothetical protein
MGKWKAQLGRITLFPIIPAGADVSSAADLYKRVWASDPDNYQKQPQAGLPFAPSFAQGSYSGLIVSCSVHPIRIDFSLSPPTLGPSLNLIEDTKQFHEVLARTIPSVVEATTTTVNRAACLAQFANVTANYRNANALMLKSLPTQYALRLSDEEDFILQLNRPRAVGELRMNFVTKWSVERLQVLSLQVGPGVIQSSGLNQLVSEHIVGTVLLDNNNSATARLSKDQLSFVLTEALRGVSDGQREAHLDLEGF